jgi:uncharacterized protein YndB with AHSA1/START domain
MSMEIGNFREKPHPLDLRLDRILNAPRELVFEALTQPEHLKNFWAPRPFTIPVCEVDLRPGGIWRYSMRSPEGWEHLCTALYQEIERPRKLVMISSVPGKDGKPIFELRQTITLEEKGKKTALALEFKVLQANPGSKPYLGGMKQGTNMTLDNLAAYLEKK